MPKYGDTYYLTAGSEAGAVCIVKLSVCVTALHCSNYTKFLEGMKVVESCIA